jgi:hypothetical protein
MILCRCICSPFEEPSRPRRRTVLRMVATNLNQGREIRAGKPISLFVAAARSGLIDFVLVVDN